MPTRRVGRLRAFAVGRMSRRLRRRMRSSTGGRRRIGRAQPNEPGLRRADTLRPPGPGAARRLPAPPSVVRASSTIPRRCRRRMRLADARRSGAPGHLRLPRGRPSLPARASATPAAAKFPRWPLLRHGLIRAARLRLTGEALRARLASCSEATPRSWRARRGTAVEAAGVAEAALRLNPDGSSRDADAARGSLPRRRQLLLKREDVHELGAFKWRGALPVLDDEK